MIERLDAMHTNDIYFYPSGWSSLLVSIISYPIVLVFIMYGVISTIVVLRKGKSNESCSEELPTIVRVMGSRGIALWALSVAMWLLTAVSSDMLMRLVCSVVFYCYMYTSRFFMYMILDEVFDWEPMEESTVRMTRITSNVYSVIYVQSTFFFLVDLVAYLNYVTGISVEPAMYFALAICATMELIVATVVEFVLRWRRASFYRTLSFVVTIHVNMTLILMIMIIDGYKRSEYVYDFSTLMFYVILHAAAGCVKLFLTGCICCCSSEDFEKNPYHKQKKKKKISFHFSKKTDGDAMVSLESDDREDDSGNSVASESQRSINRARKRI